MLYDDLTRRFAFAATKDKEIPKLLAAQREDIASYIKADIDSAAWYCHSVKDVRNRPFALAAKFLTM